MQIGLRKACGLIKDKYKLQNTGLCFRSTLLRRASLQRDFNAEWKGFRSGRRVQMRILAAAMHPLLCAESKTKKLMLRLTLR